MDIKSKNNKTRNTKNIISVPPVAAKEVADLLECSISTVKKVRTGDRADTTILGMKVKLFDEMYEAGSTVLIKEIARRFKF